MINKTICLLCICIGLVGVNHANGSTNLVISDFSKGMLTWTNVNPDLYYTVQWRPSLTGSNDWTGSFRGLQDLQSTGNILTAPVPMFYRVVGTDAPAHTLSISSQSSSIPAGYYEASDLAFLEMDLTPANIKAGISIYGIQGNLGQYHADGFPQVNKSLWTSFDPDDNGVGEEANGYSGAVFDGRFLYFVPFFNGEYHGEVLRLDSEAEFGSTNAWTAFDPGSNGVGTDPDGYDGGVFDGRYVYFSPYHNGTASHGEVLRLDTQGDFNTTNAWSTYTPHAHGVGNQVGYLGAVYDGRYVYFCPAQNGTTLHGEVLRYDTQAAFDAANSWTAFDPGSQGVGTDPDGYYGGVFDGRFVYFAPNENGTEYHGEVLRYDTQAAFATTNAWSTFDPNENGLANNRGYHGAVFDGRYIYYVPFYNGTAYSGKVLQYDTQGAFGAAASWADFDPGAAGVGDSTAGFVGATFDGRYLNFVPYYNYIAHGEVLRYDSTTEFGDVDSWTTYSPDVNGIGTNARGFHGGAFDGRYLYFVPYYNGSSYHGEVLRYDAKNPPGIPITLFGGSFL
ncbi:hypothetical protein P4B35_03315 [Pontiellaceae bacterium B12227]|nr:hypothetical protein [Pontiellaceae bacterium B12227]